MKTTHFIITLTAFFVASSAFSQAAQQAVKVVVKEVKIESIPTPQLQAGNLPAKSWIPKKWMQIDVHFKVAKEKSTDPNPYVDALEFKYYILLNASDPVSKKPILLTSIINYANISTKEIMSHALAFVPPAAINRLLGKTEFTASDVRGVGIEVNYAGQLVGPYAQPAGKWWEDLSKFSVIDGNLLPKHKTPYAPFWGDYDVEAKAQ